MGNQYFKFKQFLINQDNCAMKVGTDSVLLATLTPVKQAQKALDIGTGTGILSLMIAQQNPHLKIDAIEIDHLAFLQAKANMENSPFKNQINIHFGAFQQFVTTQKYDVIITNPPYFIGKNNFLIANQQRAKARHDNDLPFIDLIEKTINLLNDNGTFSLILPTAEALIFKKLATDKGLFCARTIHIKSKSSKAVNRIILNFVKYQSAETISEFVIYNSDNSATTEYLELTKDYYL